VIEEVADNFPAPQEAVYSVWAREGAVPDDTDHDLPYEVIVATPDYEYPRSGNRRVEHFKAGVTVAMTPGAVVYLRARGLWSEDDQYTVTEEVLGPVVAVQVPSYTASDPAPTNAARHARH